MVDIEQIFSEEDVPHTTCVEFDPDCGECTQQREEANSGTVPLSVVEVINMLLNVKSCFSNVHLGC